MNRFIIAIFVIYFVWGNCETVFRNPYLNWSAKVDAVYAQMKK